MACGGIGDAHQSSANAIEAEISQTAKRKGQTMSLNTKLLQVLSRLFLVGAIFTQVPAVANAAEPTAEPDKQGGDDAVARFEKLYSLEEGQVIKRVPPPFSSDRLAYYRIKHHHQAEAIPEGPDTMFLHFVDGKVKNWGMTFGGVRLANVLQMITKIHRQEIEADDAIKNTEISGDFVFRSDASRDELLEGFFEIVNRELDLPWTFEWREVERDTIVVTGEFTYTPLLPDDAQIHFFGAKLNEDGSGGGSSGKLDTFLRSVGQWLEMPVVNEVENPPKKGFVWRYHHGFGGSEEERELARDPDVVLTNLHLQTGLSYLVEKRTVPLLFIESAEAED